MSGGGDTPSPTLKKFKYRVSGSKQLLCTEDGDIAFIVDNTQHLAIARQTIPDGYYEPTSNWNDDDSVEVQGEIVSEESINISLNGYDSLAMTYSEDDALYIPITYQPEELT